MSRIFKDYGGVIVTVAAIALLGTLVLVLMQPGGVLDGAFGNITNMFVSKSDKMINTDFVGPSLKLDQELSKDSANPTVAESGSFVLSGKVTDDSGIASLTVNGVDVSVNEDGSWSTTLSLTQNETKEVVIITKDEKGNETKRTVHVTYIQYVDIFIRDANRHKVGYTGVENEDLIIPATFYDEENGRWCKVVGIYTLAFKDCTNLRSITIPDSVTQIMTSAFPGCSNLETVVVGDSVEEIGNQAFHGCSSLRSINIPSSVTNISQNAFQGCDSLESVYITDMNAWCNITFGTGSSNPLSYGANLYLNNQMVTDLVIPDGVAVKIYAFSGCGSITSLVIPDSVTSVYMSSSFNNCPNLKSVVVGDGVKYMPFLNNCGSLETVVIGRNITELSRQFSQCINLTSVVIPASVTSISDYVFNGCRALTSITFEGTMEQWQQIELDSDWKYNSSIREVVCSDGTLQV